MQTPATRAMSQLSDRQVRRRIYKKSIRREEITPGYEFYVKGCLYGKLESCQEALFLAHLFGDRASEIAIARHHCLQAGARGACTHLKALGLTLSDDPPQ
ncbi:MAG: hypothetical protein AAFX99_21570 [Myxococcota bacterium]